mmetsp:Transcript_44193/g.95881  ORF Transcript_44193/g.95881 Transcript_44193/m.95881 type:complete len:113 (+) Transcript_44193:215-553(+)
MSRPGLCGFDPGGWFESRRSTCLCWCCWWSWRFWFGDNAANAAVLEWLQFLVILTPGCAAVVTLVTTQEPETWLRLRRAWSRLHRNTAGGGVELFPIDAATPQADDTALTQA